MAQTQVSLILQILLLANTASNSNASAFKKQYVFIYTRFPQMPVLKLLVKATLRQATAGSRKRPAQVVSWPSIMLHPTCRGHLEGVPMGLVGTGRHRALPCLRLQEAVVGNRSLQAFCSCAQGAILKERGWPFAQFG